jgi:hypothetical protein
MQDVTSYIIARTLGVIDDTKASTSDRGSLRNVDAVEGPNAKPPAIIVQSASLTEGMPTSPSFATDSTVGQPLRLEIDRPHHPQSASSSSLYEGNPALAGVGVFSPAASTPSSPTIERKRFNSLSKSSTTMTPLSQLEDDNTNSEKAATTDGEGEEEVIKSRVGRKDSWGSMSAALDSSYALVDRESGSEDSGVLRRRQSVQTVKPIGS